MNKSHTMLPIAMVVVIAFLAFIAISSGRSTDPGLTGDRSYPFHICSSIEYCEGATCSRDQMSFIVYLEHADGQPRLEMARTNPTAVMTPVADGLEFVTRGGEVSGTLNIFRDRKYEFTGTSGAGAGLVEHFAIGTCERLLTP